MKIELKNIKYSERMSEETSCFDAFLHINGKKVAYVKNDGRGGMTHISELHADYWEVVKQAQAHCRDNMKGITCPGGSIPCTLDMHVDELFDQWLEQKNKEKFQKQIDKACESKILIGTDTCYRVITLNKPVFWLLQSEAGKVQLTNFCTKTLPGLIKPGEKVLNKNLPADILNLLNK